MNHQFKIKFRTVICQAALVTLVLALLSNIGLAQTTFSWNNISNDDSYWQFGDNWSPTGPPGAGDTAQFDTNRTYEVWWDSATGDRQTGFLNFLAGDVTLLNQGTTPFTLTANGDGTSSNPSFRVTGSGTSMTINGLNIHSFKDAGVGAGAPLSIDGSHTAGSRLTTDLDLDVQGELNSYSGGKISSDRGLVGATNSIAIATISGSGSEWANSNDLGIGLLGEGELNVESGALVTSNNGWIGVSSSEQSVIGWATVTGSGSRWVNNADFVVGYVIPIPGQIQSSGILSVEDGGLVSSGNSYLGVFSGIGHATVSGNNSQWNNTDTMSVGNTGFGTLEILDGGSVSNEVGYIGRFESSIGNVNVSGKNSYWNNRNSLIVGAEGDGTLIIDQGGLVASHFGSLGAVTDSTGSVTVNGPGSRWEVAQSVLIGGFLAEGGTGELSIDDGAKVTSGSNTFLWSKGTLNLNGGELQTQSFANTQGGTFNFNGGRLTVDGGSFLPGTSSFTIDSPAADTPTLVIRNGATASLAGRMTVGSSRNGNLIIDGGGSVSNDISIIGNKLNSTGVATVRNSGSTWDQSSLFYVGLSGNGTLNLEDGGSVNHLNNSASHIAFNPNSIGSATVTGIGSSWTNGGELNVGTGGSGTMELRLGGQVSNVDAYIGRNESATGEVTVGDDGSHWTNTGNLFVGDEGRGTMKIENGGKVSNTLKAYVGHEASSIGDVVVQDSGSHWENTEDLYVGYFGKGTLDILAGGRVSNQKGYLGANINPKAGVANVADEGSVWDNSGSLYVGEDGEGILNISAGGKVTSEYGFLGYQSTAIGKANVSGEKSQWLVDNDLHIGDAGAGELTILDGGKVSNSFGYIGSQNDSTGIATVAGSDSLAVSLWENTNDLHVGFSGSGSLNIHDHGEVVNRFGFVGSGAMGEVSVSGEGARWINNLDLSVGEADQGTLNIDSAAMVSSRNGTIGNQAGAVGVTNVRGITSQWQNTDYLTIGYEGHGTLNVETEGVVSSGAVTIGQKSGSDGTVNVRYGKSRLEVENGIGIGNSGSGVLNVSSGGKVNSFSGSIASAYGGAPTATGVVNVTGTDSFWNNAGNLRIGQTGAGTLNIQNDGLVRIGGTTMIGLNGAVNLIGGRFEFGQTTIPEFSAINAISGSMAGNLIHESYTNVGTLSGLNNPAVDISDVSLLNSGILYGHGSVDTGVQNHVTGQLQLNTGERMRFAGSGNTNEGEINNFGGTVLFAQDVSNHASGFVTGRGVFAADGGWTNEGVMAFSGTTDILGDVDLVDDGRIVTSGGATTTFYDDVVHNGSEIRTAVSSQSVFFGSVSGDSNFTGLGTVFMEGDLRPGNSPGILGFEGDLVLGAGAETFIELGGYLPGEFDQLRIDHDLVLNGALSVELYDGFQLSAHDEFLIGDVEGLLFGQFNGLSEGDLVGNFGGMNLFITYTAGSGNGVGLFTPVPEPCALPVCGLGLIGFALSRRRKKE